jgi:hypothetical protein
MVTALTRRSADLGGHFAPRLGSRLIVLGLAAAYGFTLRYAYIALIAPKFAYLRYAYRPASAPTELANWLMMMAPAFWLPVDCKRPSQMVLWYLYLLVLVPSILVPQYALALPVNEILLLSLSLTVAFHFLGVAPKLPLLSLPRIDVSPAAFWAAFATLTLALYGLVLIAFGASFTVPSVASVYTTRFAYKAQLEQAGALAGYAVFWLAEVINPILIAVGLTRRRYWVAAGAFTGQVLLLATTGFKTIAVASVLLAALIVMLRREGKRLGLLLLAGSTGLIVICATIDHFARTIIFTSVLVRRAIITPGLLTGIYYEYFSQHHPALLASSFLRFVVESPYSLPPAQIIGAAYFEGPQTNANANLWADAYANFRYPGMLFMTVALGGVLWLLDSVTANLPRRDALLFAAVPALALCNSSLQTAFVSHGIAMVLLFSYLMPAQQRSERTTAFARQHIAGPT